MADDEGKYVDIASIASPEEGFFELNVLLMCAVREAGGEVVLPAGGIEWAQTGGHILLADPEADGTCRLRLVPRVREDDERVPAGGWVHVLSGMVVHVEGIGHDDRVIVWHQKDEPGQHRADVDVDEFLRGHVRSDAVPLIGGEGRA